MRVIENRNIYNIPNFISVTRVLLIPFYIYYFNLYFNSNHSLKYYNILIFIIFIAVLSDFLDGFFARLLNEESVLGIYLDPVCDKLVTTTALISIWYYYSFPLWAIIVHLIRELIGVWFGTFLFYRRGRIQGAPNIWGKLGVNYITIIALHYISIPFTKFYFIDNIFFQSPDILAFGLLFIILIGAVKYFWDYRKILFLKN